MTLSSLRVIRSVTVLCLLTLPNVYAQPPVSEDAARAIRQKREAQRRMLLARMPIPDAARLAGGDYVVEQTIFEELVPRNLASLASESDIVVVGRVAGSVAFLSADERMISTAYQVRVEEAPKDALINFGSATGQLVTVIMPGGKVEIGNGITAEVRLRGKPGLNAGDTCVFFLQRVEKAWPASMISARTRAAYVPRLGAQGVFQLTADGVKPHGQQSPLVLAFAHTPNGDFLSRVRAAVQ